MQFWSDVTLFMRIFQPKTILIRRNNYILTQLWDHLLLQGLLTSELHSHLWILKEATALSFPRKRELDVINKYITGKTDTSS
jgi:hypothetical protein